jgi:uncharacterized membrane protein YeaQ/YmgE (transglycosylase-associated protein family)
MNETYGILGNPGVGFFMVLIIGAIAGWVAEKVTNSDHGIFTNILVGICGALVGGKLAEILEIPVFGFFRGLAAAIIGAIIVLYLWRMFQTARQ